MKAVHGAPQSRYRTSMGHPRANVILSGAKNLSANERQSLERPFAALRVTSKTPRRSAQRACRPPAIAFALLLLLATALPAVAQVALTAELTPLTLRLKANAPTPALVEFQYSGISLLEGALEVRLRDEGGNHLLTARTTDLALAAGSQTFRITLPAISNHSGSFVHAEMFFRTRAGAYMLGTRQLMVSSPMERALSAGIVQGDERTDDKLFDTIRGLRLERFDPEKDETTRRPAGRILSTYQAYVPAADASVTPLGYCCFDTIFITARGFSLLRERQLGALLVWVKAGGSVCVFPGADVKTYHLEFLNKLAGEARFELNAQGEVIGEIYARLVGSHSERSEESARESASSSEQTLREVHTERSERAQGDKLTGTPLPLETEKTLGSAPISVEDVLMRRVELGRAVVALAPVPEEEWPGWRRAAAFLSKARKAQMDSMAGKDEWDPNQSILHGAEDYRYQTSRNLGRGGLAPTPGQENKLVTAMPLTLNATNGLTDTLAPRQVRVIPFWLVGLLLVGFLGLIGPGDYFILGRLRRRKYTWVTLPVYCVAFTALFVALSSHYIGGSDHRRSLIIQDEDADGNVLRASRIEMIFTAGNRRVIVPATNSLAAAVSTAGQYYRNENRGATKPPDYAGRYPAAYQLEQQMEQWTYRVYRFLSLEHANAGRKINWKGAVPSAQNVAAALIGNAVVVNVVRFHAAESESFVGHTFGGGNDAVSRDIVLNELSVHPQANLFSLVSQLSPSGTPLLEDLALLDPTDPSQWLLAVVEQKGDDIIVHRHLYCVEPR